MATALSHTFEGDTFNIYSKGRLNDLFGMVKGLSANGLPLEMAKGVYKGRKKALSVDEQTKLKALALNGANKSDLAKQFSISRQMLYSYLS